MSQQRGLLLPGETVELTVSILVDKRTSQLLNIGEIDENESTYQCLSPSERNIFISFYFLSCLISHFSSFAFHSTCLSSPLLSSLSSHYYPNPLFSPSPAHSSFTTPLLSSSSYTPCLLHRAGGIRGRTRTAHWELLRLLRRSVRCLEEKLLRSQVTILHKAALHCTVLHFTKRCYTRCCSKPYHTAMKRTTLDYTVQHLNALHCIALYYTARHVYFSDSIPVIIITS